jgi:hypothetical protein
MTNYKKIIKLTFWFFCLPFLGLESLYFYYMKIDPFSSNTFIVSLLLIMPMLIIKTDEGFKEAYHGMLEEFREMTSSRFLECESEIMSLPLSRNSAMFKEAYRQVYKEKYGRDI